MTSPTWPIRQIHLDFHTGPTVRDVGVAFDAREFARTFRRAHVDSVTVFAKCHHGHLYYSTARPERHPGLASNLDLLGSQIEALHSEGIRAPIYLSVQVDEYAADHHPEWIALHADNSHVCRRGDGVFEPGWQILDLNTDYRDYLADQLAEVLRTFQPVDGIFFDMCWDQPSASNAALCAMQGKGLQPECEADRRAHANDIAHAYMRRYHGMVRASSREASVYFNGRQHRNLAHECRYQEQIEIEALPTGGWNYLFFPHHVRYARHFNKPYLGMTARFFKGWADFGGLKPYAALEYETSQMMAHGAGCSIGDQLHPRGRLDAAAYELIGRAYARVAARETWLTGTTAVSDVALFQDLAQPAHEKGCSIVTEGAIRLLTQLKIQFESVQPDSAWEQYRLLILPDTIDVSPRFAMRLRRYLKGGGRLVATSRSGLGAADRVLLPELGIRVIGPSPFRTTYLRFRKGFSTGIPATDHVNYEPGLRVLPRRGTRAVCQIVEPYFERAWNHFCSHYQTPGDRLTRYAAATLNRRCAYVSFPLFTAFARHGNPHYRQLLAGLLDHLLPRRAVRIEAPTGTEASVMRQDGRTILHVLHYSPERRSAEFDIIEDIVPLTRIPLTLALPRRPRAVYLAPDRKTLPFSWRKGEARIVLPKVVGHAMVVFEWDRAPARLPRAGPGD